MALAVSEAMYTTGHSLQPPKYSDVSATADAGSSSAAAGTKYAMRQWIAT